MEGMICAIFIDYTCDRIESIRSKVAVLGDLRETSRKGANGIKQACVQDGGVVGCNRNRNVSKIRSLRQCRLSTGDRTLYVGQEHRDISVPEVIDNGLYAVELRWSDESCGYYLGSPVLFPSTLLCPPLKRCGLVKGLTIE